MALPYPLVKYQLELVIGDHPFPPQVVRSFELSSERREDDSLLGESFDWGDLRTWTMKVDMYQDIDDPFSRAFIGMVKAGHREADFIVKSIDRKVSKGHPMYSGAIDLHPSCYEFQFNEFIIECKLKGNPIKRIC